MIKFDDYNSDVVKLIKEVYYEWNFSIWSNIFKSSKKSPVLDIGNTLWVIGLHIYGFNIMGRFLTIHLTHLPDSNNSNNDEEIFVQCIYSFHKPNNYTKCHILESYDFLFNQLNQNQSSRCYETYLYRRILSKLMKFKRITFGVYLKIFRINKSFVYCMENAESLFQNLRLTFIRKSYYEWTVKNWENNNKQNKESFKFKLGEYQWKIKIKTNKEGYFFSYFILLNNEIIKNEEELNICFIIYIQDCVNFKRSISKNFFIHPNKNEKVYCLNKWLKNSDLYINDNLTEKSIIENNRFVMIVNGIIFESSEMNITELNNFSQFNNLNNVNNIEQNEINNIDDTQQNEVNNINNIEQNEINNIDNTQQNEINNIDNTQQNEVNNVNNMEQNEVNNVNNI